MEKIDPIRKKKLNQAINFFEELSWLFDSKKNIDYKEATLLLRNLLESSSVSFSDRFSSPNPNKNYLIGILPNLFQDSELFKTNVDLAEFAESILKITINRPEKRSRYELIGLIVCEVTNLNETDLTSLVDSLAKLAGSNEKLKQIKEAKKQANFSWNDAIKTLSAI